MFNDDTQTSIEIQDLDARILASYTEAELDKARKADEALLAELEAIGTENECAPQPEKGESPARVAGQADSAPNSDEGVIWEPIKLTRYDKARMRVSELESERDILLGKGDLSVEDHQRLTKITGYLLPSANSKFQKEAKRALDDQARRFDSIDEYRKTEEGRASYNTKRRKVREEPNNDLSGMSEAERKQYDLDKDSDRKWQSRQRKKGVPEKTIRAELAARIQKRETERDCKVRSEIEEREMRNLDTFGMF